MNFDALLFDMDGVIIETHVAVRELWQHIADQYRIPLTEQDFDQHVFGCSPKHTIQALFCGTSLEEQRCIHDMVQSQEPHLAFTAKAGAVSWLHTLQEHGILMGLVTSGSQRRVRTVCERLNIKECFDVTITGDMITHGKPHPECYLLAARHLQKLPQRCIVFEDALSGVRSAVAAGTCCVGIQTAEYTAKLLEAGAYTVISDFTSINIGVLLQNNKQLILSLHSHTQQNDLFVARYSNS